MPKRVCLLVADVAHDSLHLISDCVIESRSESVNLVLCPRRYVWS